MQDPALLTVMRHTERNSPELRVGSGSRVMSTLDMFPREFEDFLDSNGSMLSGYGKALSERCKIKQQNTVRTSCEEVWIPVLVLSLIFTVS